MFESKLSGSIWERTDEATLRWNGNVEEVEFRDGIKYQN